MVGIVRSEPRRKYSVRTEDRDSNSRAKRIKSCHTVEPVTRGYYTIVLRMHRFCSEAARSQPPIAHLRELSFCLIPKLKTFDSEKKKNGEPTRCTTAYALHGT